MKVILKEDVADLGRMGDTVSVSDGYARNFLIPRGLVLEASNKNLKVLEHEKRLLSQKIQRHKEKAEQLRDRLGGVVCTIAKKVGEQNKLFGSVTSKDIENALKEQGIEMDRRNILLDEPIKNIGECSVRVKLHADVIAEIKVVVTPEE